MKKFRDVSIVNTGIMYHSEFETPIPIVGRHMDPRVGTQIGCFVIWGKQPQNLELFSDF